MRFLFLPIICSYTLLQATLFSIFFTFPPCFSNQSLKLWHTNCRFVCCQTMFGWIFTVYNSQCSWMHTAQLFTLNSPNQKQLCHHFEEKRRCQSRNLQKLKKMKWMTWISVFLHKIETIFFVSSAAQRVTVEQNLLQFVASVWLNGLFSNYDNVKQVKLTLIYQLCSECFCQLLHSF